MRLSKIPTIIAKAVVPKLIIPKLHTTPETPMVKIEARIIIFLLLFKSIALSLIVRIPDSVIYPYRTAAHPPKIQLGIETKKACNGPKKPATAIIIAASLMTYLEQIRLKPVVPTDSP